MTDQQRCDALGANGNALIRFCQHFCLDKTLKIYYDMARFFADEPMVDSSKWFSR